MNKIVKSLALLALAGSLGVTSCSDATEERIDNQTDSLATKFEAGVDNIRDRISRRNSGDDDKDFLADATEVNTMEMRALRLGQQRGGSEVKSHAASMLKDHQALGEEVRNYVNNKNIAFNDLDTNDRDNDLDNKQAGLEFDRAWAKKMVDDHEDAIELFEEGQREVKDPALKAMIDKALPKLRSHLDMSKQLRDKLENRNDNNNTTR